VTSTEILVAVVVVAIVVLGALWYVRGRGGSATGEGEADVQRERQQAAAAAEDTRTEAMVRRFCPHCQEEVEVRAGACVQCGYRFG